METDVKEENHSQADTMSQKSQNDKGEIEPLKDMLAKFKSILLTVKVIFILLSYLYNLLSNYYINSIILSIMTNKKTDI